MLTDRDKMDSFDNEYEALLDEFEQVLSRELGDISTAIADLCEGRSNNSCLQRLAYQVHKIRGSSGILKLQEFSAALAVMEAQINYFLKKDINPGSNESDCLNLAFTVAVDLLPERMASWKHKESKKTRRGDSTNFRLAALSAPYSKRKPRILIVEDDHVCMRYLQAVIKTLEEDVIVDSRVTLKSAQESIIENEPDLILLDLNLPDSSGLDTFHALNNSGSSTPILILTIETDKQLALDAVAAGAQDYIQKNVLNADNLIRCIYYAIARNSAHQTAARLHAIDDFMAAMSHDLKLPLEAMERVHQYLDNDSDLPSESKKLVEVLRDTNVEVVCKLKKMISLYSLETQGIKLINEKVNIKDLVTNCVHDTEASFSSRNVEVQTELPKDPIVSSTDGQVLERALKIILDNAAKYSYTNTATRVTLGKEKEGVSIEISNKGPVIDKENRMRIFKTFWKTIPGKDYVAHTGMSLYHCNQLVKMLGGRIQCQSDEKETKFKVSLPLGGGAS